MRLIDITFSSDQLAGPPVDGIETAHAGHRHVTVVYSTDDGVIRSIWATDPVCAVIHQTPS